MRAPNSVARPRIPAYLESLTRAMRMFTMGRDSKRRRKTINAEGRVQILRAIGDIMVARKAAHDAAKVYLTARAVLDGAIERLTGEEYEDED
jgi:hypothetical protein